jgi:predicted nucleotidyltransferase
MSDDPQGVLLSYADQVVREVRHSLEDENIESIFMAGSAARGQVAGFVGPGGTEVYSDLDLYVILRRPKDLESARRRARQAAAGLPRAGEGYRIYPEPDVGVFSEEDFITQKTRPGMVEIAASHVVLHGSAEAPRRAERFVASRIDPSEGLYLLENRLIEIAALGDRLERDASEGLRRYATYVRSKSCLDAVSAALIVAGRYHALREERMSRFDTEVVRGEWAFLIAEGTAARVRRSLTHIEALQGALEESALPPAESRDAVESVLLDVWRSAAARMSPRGIGDWHSLVEWRCKKGRWLANARELSVLARRMGASRAGLLGGIGTLARLSPVDALRVSGVVEAMLRRERGNHAEGPERTGDMERGYLPFVEALTRVLGHAAGPVLTRARRLFEETT